MDEMLVQTGPNGLRSFIFRADEAVVVFATIDANADAAGQRDLRLSRLEFGLRGQIEVLPILSGSCQSVDPAATWRAETTCEAVTLKGRFAAQFVTIDGTVESVPSAK